MRDRFVTVIGVEIEGQGCIAVECVWNGGAWVPDLREFRRLLHREAQSRYQDDLGMSVEEDT
jgi:hypothetical protein